jgi:hypothetical protein
MCVVQGGFEFSRGLLVDNLEDYHKIQPSLGPTS